MKLELTQYGVTEKTVKLLETEFLPLAEPIAKWKEIAESITVSDVSDREEMKKARALRLEIRPFRTSVEKVRKALKEESLNYGRAIDGVAKTIMEAMSNIEANLQEKEDFEKNKIAEEQKALETSRMAVLAEYGEYSFLSDLGTWSRDKFEAYLADQKALVEIRKAKEAEELAAEEAKQKENERLAEENRKLKAEADAKAVAFEAQLKMEREARNKLERENAMANAALRSKEADKAPAPSGDKEKLKAIADAFSGVQIYGCETEEGQKIIESIKILRRKTVDFINAKIEEIE